MKDTTSVLTYVDQARRTVTWSPVYILRAWAGELPFDEHEEIILALNCTQEIEEAAMLELRKAREHRRRMQLCDLIAIVNQVRSHYLARLPRVMGASNE